MCQVKEYSKTYGKYHGFYIELVLLAKVFHHLLEMAGVSKWYMERNYLHFIRCMSGIENLNSAHETVEVAGMLEPNVCHFLIMVETFYICRKFFMKLILLRLFVEREFLSNWTKIKNLFR